MPVSHQAWPLPVTSIDSFSYADLTIDEALEDLASRFIFNIPEWERNSMERVGFQIESAHWYYEDFVREQNQSFPTCSLKRFFGYLWKAAPLLNEWHSQYEEAFDRFVAYKGFVPVCGAIILNEACDKVVLVKGWKNSAGWGFPKGKINQNEGTLACAIREVLEETGFNIKDYASEEHVLKIHVYSQVVTLYIVHPVPEDTIFETRTRKEISRIEWFRLADLPGWGRARVPGKFFLVNPFMHELKLWISQHKRELQLHEANQHSATIPDPAPKKAKKGKDRPTHARPENRVSFQGYPFDSDQAHPSGNPAPSDDQISVSDLENIPGSFSADLLESLIGKNATPQSNRSRPTSLRAPANSNSELSSGVRSANQSTFNSPELLRVSSGPLPSQPPPMARSQTDKSNLDSSHRGRMRDTSRATARSSISSSSSTSISPVETKQEVSKRARDLLDLFADDAARQTPGEPPSRGRPTTMPATLPNPSPSTLPGYFPAPGRSTAALVAGFRQPGAPEGPHTPLMHSSPSDIGPYHNLTPMSFPGLNGAALYPGMMTGSLPYSARPPVGMHMNIAQLSRMPSNGHPSLSHPVQTFPYRPASVPPPQETTAQRQAYAPDHASSGPVSNEPVPNNPPAVTSSSHNPSVRGSPAASVPRNVPHAQQLLALFHEPPSIS